MAAGGKPIRSPQSDPAPGAPSAAANAIRVALLAVMIVGSVYLLRAHTQWFDDPHLIKSDVTRWGGWGPFAYILLYAVGPSLLVPGAVMTVAGGLAFGTVWGAAYAVAGADLGALVAFGAGRFLGKRFVQRVVGERFNRTMGRIARNGFRIIFYLRIVPVIPYNALNLIAGASPIAFRDYFWASVIGMIPGTVAFAFLGDSLWHPASPRFFLALALIAACLGLGEAYRRWSAVSVEP